MILWGDQHKDRGVALAAAYHEQSSAVASLPRGSDGISPLASADATLTVWGHGDATTFSEMLEVEFGVLLRSWKKKNPALKTVEIVTCDARHNSDHLSGYAARVAQFVHEVYKDVVVKALPVGQHRDDRSILWANAGTTTFCYITAPSEATFNHANQVLQGLDPTCGHDLGKVAQEMAKTRGRPPNDFTVMGGNLNILRNYLGVVR